MGRKKLNFSRTDFKKSDAQSAGFKTKGAALKFFKHTPKNKLDNFKSVVELVEYIKNQKDKLKTFGLDVDFLFKQKPRLTKEQKLKTPCRLFKTEEGYIKGDQCEFGHH